MMKTNKSKGIEIKIDIDLEKIAAEHMDKVQNIADKYSVKMESYAKKNAPWTDRTTNARNSIQGVRKDNDGEVALGVRGNVSYFKYLEFAHGKKWAILKPTVDKFTPEIIDELKKIGD